MDLLDIASDDAFEDQKRLPTKPKRPDWLPPEIWTHEGWVARVRPLRCGHCQRVWHELVGVFSKETRGPNMTRYIAVKADFPLAPGKEVLFDPEVTVPHCIEDLESLGFTKMGASW